MPKLRALKQHLYLSRMLQVGDEFEPMPGDVQYFLKRGRAEVVEDAPRRGRPPKVEAASDPEPGPQLAEPEVPEPTRDELLARAEELGVELPSGYVPKATLVDLVGKAEKAEDDN